MRQDLTGTSRRENGWGLDHEERNFEDFYGDARGAILGRSGTPVNGPEIIDALAELVAGRVAERGGASQRLFSVDDAATYLGRTKPAVQNLIAGGTLPVVRIDRRVMLDRQDLDRLIDECKNGGRHGTF